ncbi:hypothetical protein TNCV_371751 [Trichonephila clavipes]|nr:hypothetical protein TNCV_371751 [Trichonephila clavipes]
MDICQCIVPLQHGGTLNSHQAASPLLGGRGGSLVAGNERPLTFFQGVLPQNWGGTELNHTVTCMVLKAKVNDGHTSSPSQ